MKVPRSCGVALLACLLTTGCLTHRAPRRVKAALEDAVGGPIVRESGVKLGWASTRLVAGLAGSDESLEDSLELGDVARGSTAHTPKRGEDVRLLHHPPRQRGIERRQRQRAVLEHFDQLPACPE